MYHNSTLHDEPARLAAVKRMAVLDTAPEQPFEDVVALVRSVLGVPMAAVSLIDEHRQWFKARSGIAAAETARDVSFCTHTIGQRVPMVVPDATADARFMANPFVTGEANVRSYAGVPLETADGYNIGALCAVDTKPRDYSEGEIAILANLARIVVKELELRQIAQRDPLTGALSRRGFMDKAAQEIGRTGRYGHPASLIMLDVDHFKSVNDTHGHPAGDQVLRELAGLLTMLKRPSDVLGRLGGEEFALLLPETGADSALAAAERFRAAVAEHPIELTGGIWLKITASFGVAALTPRIATPEDWLAAADGPLYAAKRGGRNRCVLGGAPSQVRLSA
ncbi:sensor domain-containing diguanylate cyclase [Novosphingobium flavum]|uniref:diguanylate cyclase n=1 Tax=Novosphingobium flavum TaxID=1778672 RepID=A0A7X1KMS4_9SPHN|nr:sensor domain-containing diguanylate cyclase [Novosphingobium flavum]MBC2666959.1 sensor domain-containing diguanylate cyclase [Novosphingobium flavum]